jgi:hypothetical protein|tara:strand:- start:68 stop:2032 length:1965 start_codon:yes stop_codon:yes gene_type:complete
MLQKLKFVPGFNKQATESGAEGQWTDGDYVRFRYGLPEKIGGWSQLTASEHTLPGVARASHTFQSLDGERYSAIGTSQGLFLFYGSAFYDISPLDTAITGCTLTTSSGAGTTITINKASHGLLVGRYITLSAVSVTGDSTLTAGILEKAYEILTVATDSFTITASTAETGTGMTAAGAATVNPYYLVGPTTQTKGYGWGTYVWGDSTWGTERTISTVTLDPGNWSLDNYGQVLVATISDGKTFTWNAGASGPRAIRASQSTTDYVTTSNPTASMMTLVSDRDRHLFHIGTETTIGDPTTQDKMFIRFSDQENLNSYTPTAVNTAGTFRLDAGNEIRAAIAGKDYNLILTDTAAYIAQYVGPPFTFSIRQVGTNCGCMGMSSAIAANGAIYWMGNSGGFFRYDGTVKSVPCLVEDFVFNTDGDNLGINYVANKLIYAGHNSLYTEVNWFYAQDGSSQIDRCVTFNYGENVWTTSSLDRTTWTDANVFDTPYATDYAATTTPVFPDILGLTSKYGAAMFYAQETGTDQVNSTGTTSIDAYIRSGDYDITSKRNMMGQSTGVVDFRGDGEYFMAVRRIIPDFKYLTGNAKMTLYVSSYPDDIAVSSPLGPFTVTTTTDKIDTRARGRLVSINIANDATGETWRYGTLRLDAQADGRR